MIAVKKIAVLNGSPAGGRGNTALLLKLIIGELSKSCEVESYNLVDVDLDSLREKLRSADGFVIGTGTYWDSWGSPLQAFLEKATPWETDDVWFGKPTACIVTMHSIGGKGVLSRLQGVMNTLGVMIPPMCGMAYSFSNQAAVELDHNSELNDDLWQLCDTNVVAHNLIEAVNGTNKWERWIVNGNDADTVWLDVDVA